MENTENTTNVTESADTTNSNLSQSLVDRQVAIARARLAAKQANGQTPTETERPAIKRAEPTIVDDAAVQAAREARLQERLAAKASRDHEREARKGERDAARAAKLAERTATAKPSHMSKVEKAGAALPAMDDTTSTVYDLVKSAQLTEGQLTILGAHLAHINRVNATLRSKTASLSEGQLVEIVASDRDARLIGLRGTIAQVRKIRVLVDIPGHVRQAYLFCSDVVPVPTEIDDEFESDDTSGTVPPPPMMSEVETVDADEAAPFADEEPGTVTDAGLAEEATGTDGV